MPPWREPLILTLTAQSMPPVLCFRDIVGIDSGKQAEDLLAAMSRRRFFPALAHYWRSRARCILPPEDLESRPKYEPLEWESCVVD